MLNEWLYLGIFLIIALAIPAAALLIAGMLSPKKPNPIKDSTYECGMETVGVSWVQFKVQYYIYGLIFLVFDVEIVLLYPWAVAYNKVALFGVIELILFVAILASGLLYAWRKGALEWV
ncbi:MAG: NADH-quinone oxidoreductase subunit A [Anaerolineae bacterium]|nr:NADH-quinone oxidoreductase subunit A [Anaerolineae bacterium]PKO00645.1 MAG: NADH-quinone oxidoreductase subunit A [Chloroflexi bacterium HGW-Chloroflexi-5]